MSQAELGQVYATLDAANPRAGAHAASASSAVQCPGAPSRGKAKLRRDRCLLFGLRKRPLKMDFR